MPENENETVNATEAALAFAEENSVDITKVEGTGAEGKVGLPDVKKYLESQEDEGADDADQSDEDADDTQDDEAADSDEGESEPDDEPEVEAKPVVKGTVIANFKEDRQRYRVGDKYEGKNGSALRKSGLIK